jgi:multidrug resistance efflux pump
MNSFLTPELRKRLIIWGGSALVILVIGGVAVYFITASKSIYIDTATISAPLIELTPISAGPLNAVYVNEGDTVAANTPVAEVGTEIISTKVGGTIVQVNNTIGAQIAPGQVVVEMVDPSQLRVVGSIDENKGLTQIQIGDPASFTVDAFGSKSFTGVVDEIAPTSNQSDVVFNISDQRETQQFDIKVRFDESVYPQLKNGMSARIWIYKQ